MNNIKERAIVPFNPASSTLRNKDVYNLYAPMADINKVGMAGFNPTDFSVNDGIVNVKEDRLIGVVEQQSLNKVDKTQKIADITLETDITKDTLRQALSVENIDNTSDIDKPLSNATRDALVLKQDNLTFDDAPILNSNNPIKSGAVHVVKTVLQDNINLVDTNLQSTRTLIGNDDISDIAPTIATALVSLNEDIDSLQLGVVPRVIRGFINYDTAGGILTEELIQLLNDKVLEMTGRIEPNNSDAIQVIDTLGPDKDIMYTYYYWTSGINENVPSELDGWYLAYSALSQMIENIPSYSLNFNDSAWVLGEDGYSHIIIVSNQHNMGIDNTIDIELLKLVDGLYEPIKQFTVSGTGDIDIYTDDLFSGTLIVRTSKAYRLPIITLPQSQIDGLEDDLQALEKHLATKKTNDLAIKLKAKTPIKERWESKTWTGLPSFYGFYIWTDGTNIYYSRGTEQYELDVATSTWSSKTWTGLTNFDGNRIWTDGTNIYCSLGTEHYKLNVETSTWSGKTWTGLPYFDGEHIWTDGTNIYYSSGTSQYKLDVETSTLSIKTWTGLPSFYGRDIWTDGTNIYYSNGTKQYGLDVATSTWSSKTWNCMTDFFAYNIWTDGTNIYGSDGIDTYKLNVETSTWSSKTWNGMTYFDGRDIWTDGTNIYCSEGTYQHKFIPVTRLR